MAIDAQQVEQGITLAQAVVTFVSGLGVWEGAKTAWAYFAARRQAARDAEAKKIQDAADAAKKTVEQSRDARKDAIGEVWKIAEERQQEVDRLNAERDKYHEDCHDRIDAIGALVTKLQADNLECEKKTARLETRLELLERNGHGKA